MRESYIPIGKPALIAALAQAPALPGEDQSRFADLCRVLAALIHFEAFAGLERLKLLYAPLDPDEGAGDDADQTAFLQAFEAVLARANFSEASAAALLASADLDTLNDVRIRTNEAGIASIRFFTRGGVPETVVARRWWGLVKKAVETEVYDDVIVLVALKRSEGLGRRETRAFAQLRRGARPGGVLIKHFGGVPRIDLPSLHPGAAPTMKRRDQVVLGVPAIAGGAPLLIQLFNAVPVIFAVAAAYFGMQGAVSQDRLQHALAALSGVIALGAFLMRQRLKFDRQRLVYQRRLAETVYFHTVANNAGVIDGLVGAAEAQDAKEAILAWWALRVNGPMAKGALDKAVEAVLRETFALDLDFEIGDALEKLVRFGLVREVDGVFTASAGQEALAALDRAWDQAFTYAAA